MNNEMMKITKYQNIDITSYTEDMSEIEVVSIEKWDKTQIIILYYPGNTVITGVSKYGHMFSVSVKTLMENYKCTPK